MEQQNPLTAEDRCDRCGAQAYAVSQHGTARLLWCGHHYQEHFDAIVDHLVHDETHKIREALEGTPA